MRKRRIRIFPIICFAVIIALVVWAVTLIAGVFGDKKPSGEINSGVIEENFGDNINHDKDNEEILPVEKEEPIEEEIPVEDTLIFEEDAPRPVYSQAELLNMYSDTVLPEGEKAVKSYIDKIIFVGDSTTNGLKHYGVLDGGKNTDQVWTPKSGTLAMWNLLTENIVYPDDGSEMTIADAVSVKEPEIMVLTLGVNGVSSLSEEDFVKYYSSLIDVIKENSSNTKIILQSIYPVCDYYEYVKSISMEKINAANAWIADLANEKGVYYLNTITALVNENGYLNDEYCNGDGIHISEKGFKVILDYIESHPISE